MWFWFTSRSLLLHLVPKDITLFILQALMLHCSFNAYICFYVFVIMQLSNLTELYCIFWCKFRLRHINHLVGCAPAHSVNIWITMWLLQGYSVTVLPICLLLAPQHQLRPCFQRSYQFDRCGKRQLTARKWHVCLRRCKICLCWCLLRAAGHPLHSLFKMTKNNRIGLPEEDYRSFYMK